MNCPACGRDRHSSDRFCGGCGTPFAPPAQGPRARGRTTTRATVRTVGIGVGLVALGLVSFSLVNGLRGSAGGARSADGAARELADAVSNRDVLRALGLVAPGELRFVDGAYKALVDKASAGKWVDPTDPLAPVGIDIAGLETEVEPLGKGVSKVSIRRGVLTASFEASRLAERVRSLIPEEDQRRESVTVDAADLRWMNGRSSVDPFVMTVERGGRWYVSPMYTMMEYLRMASDLPPADFDAADAPAAASQAPAGADTPEQALSDLAQALTDYQLEDVIRLLPAAESDVLRAYRPLLTAVMADSDFREFKSSVQVTVGDLQSSAEREGNVARVAVTSSRGTFSFPGDSDCDYYGRCSSTVQQGTWNQDGACFSYQSSHGSERFCVDQVEPARLLLGSVAGPRFVAVQEEGRWHISVIGTFADQLRASIESLGERQVLVLLQLPELAKPDGPISVGGTVSGTLDEVGLTVYSLSVKGSTRLTTCVTPESDTAVEIRPAVPNGTGGLVDEEYGAGVNLRAGEYRVIVTGRPRTQFRAQIAAAGSACTLR